MFKKIATTGAVLALCSTTPVMAEVADIGATAGIIESPFEIDKAVAESEITVYKDAEMKETSGKLFTNNIADVVAESDNLLKIKSGELQGYVKKADLKTREEAKEHILSKDIKGVIKADTKATSVKNKEEDLLKAYSPEEKEEKTIKEGEEYIVRNYGNKVVIEKGNELYSVEPEDIDINYQHAEGKTDAVIAFEKKEKEDTEAANKVMALFDALADDIELSDKTDIEDARKAYNNLTEDQKKKVTTLDSLEEAEDELAQEEKEEQERIEKEEAEKKAKEEALKTAEEQAATLASSSDREATATANADIYNEIAQAGVSYDYVDTSDWDTGVASAYGGYSDASIPSNAHTATGDSVTETSMGVAVPMAWSNFRSLYGHKVLINYGGRTVTATINDCGGMGGGSRSLDLQPGVFRAFGYTNCNDWGLKTVKYKIL